MRETGGEGEVRVRDGQLVKAQKDGGRWSLLDLPLPSPSLDLFRRASAEKRARHGRTYQHRPPLPYSSPAYLQLSSLQAQLQDVSAERDKNERALQQQVDELTAEVGRN